MKDDIKPGDQLTLAQINRILKGKRETSTAPSAGNDGGAEGKSMGKPSDGLKVDELRAALEAKGIEIPEGAKKADLQELLDSADEQSAGE